MPRLCVPIVGPSFTEIEQQIAAGTEADLLEFRIDRFSDFRSWFPLRQSMEKPVIFTFRTPAQGGRYEGPAEQRFEFLQELVQLRPDYLDLELEVAHWASHLQGPQLILSYHNFAETPADLDELYAKMKRYPATFYKIACHAHSGWDALRLVQLMDHRPDLIAIAMGEQGILSRVVSALRAPWTFASLADEWASAPGQITLEQMWTDYGVRRLFPRTPLYGLIGNPVAASPSDKTHNALMRTMQFDGVYLKICLKRDELADFLGAAPQLGFRGLSVTIPFKEEVIPYLDCLDEKAGAIGAVNTILWEGGRSTGYNTDAAGALDAIERHRLVRGERVVILGAGGTAKALLYETLLRGGTPLLLNRTPEKANALGRIWGVESGSLTDLFAAARRGYDILINTTPEPMPIPAEAIFPGSLAMDVKIQPRWTPFLEAAAQRGCQIVFGYEMFLHQAVGQFQLWFPGTMPKEAMERALLKMIQQQWH